MRVATLTLVLAGLSLAPATAQSLHVYGGATGGGAAGTALHDFRLNVDYAGASLGGFAGVKASLGPVMLGAELDYRGYAAGEAGSRGADAAIAWKGTALGVASLSLGPVAPYLGAGMAVAGQRARSNTPDSVRDAQTHAGATVAAGLDLSLPFGVFARAEARTTHYLTGGTFHLGSGTSRADMMPTHEVSVGLGYTF